MKTTGPLALFSERITKHLLQASELKGSTEADCNAYLQSMCFRPDGEVQRGIEAMIYACQNRDKFQAH